MSTRMGDLNTPIGVINQVVEAIKHFYLRGSGIVASLGLPSGEITDTVGWEAMSY